MRPTPQQHSTRPAYRPDIDGLRAVAILSVVIYHALPTVVPGGFVGVDVFFVISGFLISTIIFKSLERDQFSLSQFYVHRIKRIFPALVTLLVACYAIGWKVLLPDEYAQLGKHIAAGAGFIQNFVLWKESGYFDSASELKPLMHLWSLAIEEQFYLIYPLMCFLMWRLRFNVFASLVAMFVVSFVLNVKGIKTNSVRTYFAPHTRFWELLAGGLLAYFQLFRKNPLQDWLKKRKVGQIVTDNYMSYEKLNNIMINSLAVVGLLLIVYSSYSFSRATPFPGWNALIPVLGSFLLILSGPAAWVNRNILANRIMVFVGMISYPLYLWHWPLLSFARITEADVPSWHIRVTALGISFFLAWLTYQLIEKPVRFRLKSRKVAWVLCALLAAIGGIGWRTFASDGLDVRMTATIQRLYEPQFSWNYNSREACEQAYPFKGEYCMVAKPTPPTILVLGDSHANHVWFGLAENLKDTNENTLNIGSVACMPFFDVSVVDKGMAPRCHEYMQKALAYAMSTPSIHTVVLSMRGPIYFTGKGLGPDEAWMDKSLILNTQPELTSKAQIIERAMRNTLDRLLAANKKVIVALDNPEIGFDPKSCIDRRPVRLKASYRKFCAVTRADFESRSREYRDVTFSVLKSYPTVQVFDPVPLLCDQSTCWAMKDGKMLYGDNNHLSMDGARLIGQTIRTLLRPPQ